MFYQRIWYVEYYSVHEYMVPSQKFRLTPGFTDFQPCTLSHEGSHRELFAKVPSLMFVLWQYSFSCHLRFMTAGADRNKDRFKNWKLCGLWKLPFRNHRAINLTQNCVCFTNPCINLFFSTSFTREYHPEVLERLHLLQCISAHLRNTLPLGVLRDTIPQSFQSWFSFLLGRTLQKTDQMRAEYPIAKMHACSTNSSTKSKRFILQFPTVTPSSTRLWLSIKFIWTRALQIAPHKLLHNSSRAGKLCQIHTFFVNILFLHYWQNVFCGRAKWLCRSDLACLP